MRRIATPAGPNDDDDRRTSREGVFRASWYKRRSAGAFARRADLETALDPA
jgi:hypothetical protein